MKKILNFLYFSRLVGYVFVGELFLLGIASVVGTYKEGFGGKLLNYLFYSYIQVLPEKYQQALLAPCVDLGCAFPPLNIWGRIYSTLVIVSVLYLVACVVQWAWEFFAERRTIKNNAQ